MPDTQTVLNNTNDLLERVKTEGVTDAQGNVLKPATQPSANNPAGVDWSNFNPTINTQNPIPSNYLVNPITNTDLQNMIQQNNATYQKYISSLTPPQQMTDVQRKIAELQQQATNENLNAEAGIMAVQNEPIPISISSGKQANIQNQANLRLQTLAAKQQPLISELNIASSNWQANQNALKAALDYGQTSLSNLVNLQGQAFQQQQSLVTQAMNLSRNQRESWASVLDALKFTDPTKYTSADNKVISQYAKSIGITPEQMTSSLYTQYVQMQTEKRLKESQIWKNELSATGGASDASITNWASLLMTGQASLVSVPAALKTAVINKLSQLGGQIKLPQTQQQQTNQANAQSAMSALDILRNALDQDGSVFQKIAATPLGLGWRDVRNAQKEAADVITRLRTGAALNENEMVFYRGYVPSWQDSPEDAKRKIEFLQNFYGMFTNSGGLTWPEIKKEASQRLQTGEILVQDKTTGQVGGIPEKEYDPKKYMKLTP